MTEQANPMRAMLQRALARIEALERELAAARRERHQPIAILGAACRLPGGVDDPAALWSLLDAGADVVTEISAERWTLPPARRGDPAQARSGRWAGQLAHPDRFDAAFFNISPREALTMDPQHRLLLEVSWEALERAGIVPASLLGTATGVFVGVTAADYNARVLAGDPALLDAYAFTGNLLCVAAGRLSYTFGLQGPCMALDTACSSSLVAVHQAVQSLRAGESSLALVGGANLVLDPTHMRLATRLSALSAEGRCKTFDAGADGFARGEGCVMFVLKRLDDALRDGDPVRAVIRGSAINQDGRSTGLTAPNGGAQEALLRAALRDAGLAPEQIDHVEAHGTGTPLGDPIELGALLAVLGAPRADGSRCAVGSVKTNLGHTEAAAGATSLLKVLLSLEHGRIPRHLGFETLNPRVSLDGTALTIPVEPLPWPAGARPRHAGVSSFGLSGTNAHVLLGDPPARPAPPPPAPGAQLLVLSARSPEALRELAGAWQALLRSAAGRAVPLRDLAAAAALRRSRFERSLAVVGASHDALAERLQDWSELGEVAAARPRPKVAFVFPGQGSQWTGMGRALYRDEPVFRAAIDACERAFAPHVDWSLVAALHDDRPDALARIDIVQPTLFALGYALAAQWRAWGVEPGAVVGHSMGEVAAAAVSGVLTLDDAARVICGRSRLLRRVTGQGAMLLTELSVAAGEQEIADAGHTASVAVAVCNGPRTTVLSGATAALQDLHDRLAARGVFARWVKVDVASHSPQMDPLTPDLLALLAPVEPRPGALELASTVDLELGPAPRMDAAYWVRNLRAPVRFADAVAALHARGYTLFLECSPHPILVPAIEATLREQAPEVAALPSLRRDHDEREALLDTLARAHLLGLSPAWSALFPGPVPAPPLPTYPFQRERYWLAHADADGPATPTLARSGHPLLTARLPSSLEPGTTYLEGWLRADQPGWARDHRVGDAVVLPAAALLELALAAARPAPDAPAALAEVALHEALVLRDEPTRVQLVLTQDGERGRFRLASQAPGEAGFTLHATGELRPAVALEPPPLADLRARLRGGAAVPCAAYYDELAGRGLRFGPAFRGLASLSVLGDELLAELIATEQVAADPGPYLIHPALLDSALQGVLAGPLAARDIGYLPVAVARACFTGLAPGARLWSHLRLRRDAPAAPGLPPSLLADATLYRDDGAPIAELSGLRLRPLEPRADDGRSPLWTVAWSPAPLPAAAPLPATRWLVLARPGGRGQAVGEALAARGHAITWVTPGPATRRLAPERWELDLERPEALVDIVRAAFSTSDANGGLLHLLGLDAELPAEPDPAALAALWHEGVAVGLQLVQALARAPWRNAPRLFLVTRGATTPQGAASDAAAPWLAPLHGLGGALAYEHPELRCKRIDLPRAPAPADLDALRDELLADDREDLVALHGARHVARLSPRPWARPAADPPRLRGTWLVSGGLGGLGLSLARWLGAHGAERIVLAGRRRELDPAQTLALAAARATGAIVEPVACDVVDRPALDALIAELERDGPPLRGVVHAAVVLRDGLLLQQDRPRFAEVMAPKILGAWNLHQAVRGRELDHFILYGSAAVALGSPGQANYMAAGSFLGALARHRRGLGLPALCVDWGAFTSVGAAVASADRGERLGHRGLQGMSPAEGEAHLGRLLADDEAHVAVLQLDVRQWLEFFPQLTHQPWFAGLRELAGRASEPAGATVRAELDPLPPEPRARRLEQHVREQIAAVLRLPPTRLERDTPLKTYGVDSLMGLEMRNRLERSLGLRLSATLIWSYPTLTALVAFLGEQLWPAAADPAADVAEPDAAAQDLAALSEAEKEALLAAKLAALEELL